MPRGWSLNIYFLCGARQNREQYPKVSPVEGDVVSINDTKQRHKCDKRYTNDIFVMICFMKSVISLDFYFSEREDIEAKVVPVKTA